MNIDKQISRGMERVICRREGEHIGGLYGLSGLEDVDNFTELGGLLTEAGFAGIRGHMKQLRAEHDCSCQRIKAALPIAARATQLMEENDSDLAGVFSKIGKAVKKIAKKAVKLSPSHALIGKSKALRKISPAFRVADGTTPLIAAAVGPPKPTDPDVVAQLAADKAAKKKAKQEAAAAKKAAKAAAKQAKKDAKAAAALANAGVQSGTPPAAAGAAVLANQSGVDLSSATAQQFAQQTAANAAYPGSAVPDQAMFAQPEGGSGEASAGGISPVVMIAGGAAVLGVLFLATRKR